MRLICTLIGNRRPLRHSRRLIVFLIAVTLVAVNAVPSLVTARSMRAQPLVSPTPTVSTLTGTFQVINNGPNDQTNPDVDCNVTSYASRDTQGNSWIHFIASANVDYTVPGNGLDFVPSVSGNRIAFTEVGAMGDEIGLFNVMTLIRTDIPGV